MAPATAPDPPVASRAAVLRPRLLGHLGGRFARRLTVVVAPAGFGKTTLLSQAVQENLLAPQGTDRWLTCRPGHDLLSVFAGALRAALDLPALSATGATVGAVAVELADALWAAAPEQVALVLDDVHHLGRESPGAALLVELLGRLPGNAHLVLGCRPPVPVPVARLLASGEALLLGEQDLEFSAAELDAFAGLRDVPAEHLHRVGRWPALAELQASVGTEAVSDYLWEELLAGLLPERRGTLAALLAIGGADADLAQEVLGSRDLPALLRDLPLVAATGDGWWSLHPLWEPALRPVLDADATAQARREAGGVLRRRGRLHEAMTLLLFAQAWDDVRDLVLQACGSFFPLVPVDVLQQWWQRLPAIMQDEPTGLLLAGMAAESRDPVEGARLLELAHEAAAGQGEVALSSTQSLTMISFWRSDTRRLPELHERLAGLAAHGHAEASATLSLSRALLARDVETVRCELASAPLLASARLAPAVDWLRAHLLLLHLGDPQAASVLALEALPRVPSTLRAAVRCELVECLRLLGRLDDTAEQVTALLEDVEHSLVRTPRHLLAALVVRAVSGDRDGAAQVLDRLRDIVATSPVVWSPWALVLGEAHVALAGGDEAEAAAVLAPYAGQSVARCRTWLRINPSALPLLHVLAPATRPAWDALRPPGCFADSLAAADALAALRRGSLEQVRALRLPSWDRLAGQLPLAWTVELATARHAVGLPEGPGVLARLGQAARPALRELAGRRTPMLTGAARALLAELPAQPLQHVELRVLGPLRLLLDGVEVHSPDLRRERVRVLLGRLLLTPSQPRARLAASMWPDLDEPAAGRNLRVTLNYLQRLLEPDRPPQDGACFLRSTGPVLQLLTGTAFDVDAWRFDALLDEAERAERQAAPSLATTAYRSAVTCYDGELLADLAADDWLEAERERLRTRFVAAAVRLGQLLLVQDGSAEVEALALRALAADAYSEPAFVLLASVRLRRGDRAGAGRALQRCRARLAELGVDPMPAMLRLEREVRDARAR